MKKIISSVAFIVVLALVLTTISKYNGRTKYGLPGEEYVNPDIETVRISIDPYIGWNALLIANGGLTTTADSINARNGIKIEYVVESDADKSSDMLISGNIQGAGYTINRVAFLQSKFDEAGVDIIMPYISNYSNGGDGIICSKEIKSVEDLVGRTIAVPEHSEAQTLIEWLLQNSSLTDEQVEEIRNNMMLYKTADETAEAFFSGKADAAATWEPHLTRTISSTESRILFDTSMATNLIMDGLIFNNDFAKNHEEFLVKFIDGALEANDRYLNEYAVKAMPDFQLNTDEELREMCEYASVATWADNVNILNTTCIEVYEQMANIWISIGEKADPNKGKDIFTDKYVIQLEGKYPKSEITSFVFSEEGRKVAETISNDAALMSVTLKIEFEPGNDKIKPESTDQLVEFAKVAKLLNGCYIQIEGNTAKIDGKDGVEESKARARSVAKYLQGLGIAPNRMFIVGNGDKYSGNTEEGRNANRYTKAYFVTVNDY